MSRNEGMVPYLTEFLSQDETRQLAMLLGKIIAGYREFYKLPRLEGADTISPAEHESGALVEPEIGIAFLEELLDQAWTILDEDDEEGSTS